jgi:hypothetical protein
LPKWKLISNLGYVSVEQPSADEARAAIAMAAEAEAAVRSSDRLYRSRLLVIAGVTVALAIVVELLGSMPNWLGSIEAMVSGLAIAGATAAMVFSQMRQRAYSRSGKRWFSATLVVWVVWGNFVLRWAAESGWIGYEQPPLARGWHFVLCAMVATVPLLVGALLIGRRR